MNLKSGDDGAYSHTALLFCLIMSANHSEVNRISNEVRLCIVVATQSPNLCILNASLMRKSPQSVKQTISKEQLQLAPSGISVTTAIEIKTLLGLIATGEHAGV